MISMKKTKRKYREGGDINYTSNNENKNQKRNNINKKKKD